MDLNINVEEHFNHTTSSPTTTTNKTPPINNSQMEINFDLSSYGLPLEEVYNLARNFIKGLTSVRFKSYFFLNDYFFKKKKEKQYI